MCDEQVHFPSLSSCLSQQVRQLLLEDTWSDKRDNNVFNHQGCLDVEYISYKLSDSSEAGNDSPTNYRARVQALAPMLHSVEDRAVQWVRDEVVDTYSQLLSWTNYTELILSTWMRMFDDDNIEDLTVLLVATSIVERSLGDLFLLNGQPPCPSMLKDLLQTEELQDILGPHMILILRTVIGPPTSLNIRNVVWHGFPYPGEIPRRCIWFILVIFPTIGSILQQQQICSLPHRNPLTLLEVRPISDWSLNCQDDTWLAVVSQTSFCQWPCKQFWEKVRQNYNKQQYGVCVGLVLYYLEQGLRRVFASTNNCPQRVLTAELSTLYTTLNEILAPCQPNGDVNQLRYVLSEPVLEVLFDLLMYQDGPRVRDRLSHGETDWLTLPACLADSLITVTVLVSAMFVPQVSSVQCDALTKLRKDIEKYTVQFHPIAMVKSQILELLSIDILRELHLSQDLTEWNAGNQVSKEARSLEFQTTRVCHLIQQCWADPQLRLSSPAHVLINDLDQFRCQMKTVLKTKIPTLYREEHGEAAMRSSESEIITLLRHILSECLNCSTNMCQFAVQRQQQLASKVLRSRQRTNFTSFLECMPQYMLVWAMCCLVATWQLHHLSHTCGSTASHIRFMKSVLKVIENLRTFSSPANNKWKEGSCLCSQLIQHTVEYFSHIPHIKHT